MSDYRDILERALLSESGLRCAFRDANEAHRFRHGCNRLRKQERLDDAKERGVEREHGQSQFDNLILKWSKDEPSIVTIEHGAKVVPISIEEIGVPAQSSAGTENNG